MFDRKPHLVDNSDVQNFRKIPSTIDLSDIYQHDKHEDRASNSV